MTTSNAIAPYRPKHPVRIVTAASLFDGHDVAINIMRRLLQQSGAEIIHLGHNRSVAEIVDCAIQEDAQAIAITSYQGGHVEYLKYMFDLLAERDARVRIFAGGGGTILPTEIEALHAHGIARIYSPDDGRAMGLQGMINDLIEQCDFSTVPDDYEKNLKQLNKHCIRSLAQLISAVENDPDAAKKIGQAIARQAPEDPRANGPSVSEANGVGVKRRGLRPRSEGGASPTKPIPVLGITGTGGSGKSSLIDEFVRRFLMDFPDKTVAIISIDPSKRKTGGALLGDRIRMNAIHDARVYMRSLATRQSNVALSRHLKTTVDLCKTAGFDFIIVETSGIGQSDTEIVEHADLSLYVMTSEYGAATQLEKIDMIDFADAIAINKFDKRGSLDALRDVRKQYRRSQQKWDDTDEALPIFGTIASQFNDAGMHSLYRNLIGLIAKKTGAPYESSLQSPDGAEGDHYIIPPDRNQYLAEIADNLAEHDQFIEAQVAIARRMYQLNGTIEALRTETDTPTYLPDLIEQYDRLARTLDPECQRLIDDWPQTCARYRADTYQYKVRNEVIKQDLFTTTLSQLRLPKIALPQYEDWGDLLHWLLTENTPGQFPYTGGVFPLRRDGEDPTRMFAGEGDPERTNKRFHFLCHHIPAKRLSTAFDSVTLYGEDPAQRPDIYGKIGNSGVSLCTIDDAKKLYSGFNLTDPTTSVSMTINGPAPIVLAFFMNAAIDQQCELHLRREGRAKAVDKQIRDLYRQRGLARAKYQGRLPEGNNGLGLMLLGVSGDEILDQETYQRIKADALRAVRGTVQADILKEDQAQNTCIFSTEFGLRMMGDIQAYFSEHSVRNFYSVSISGYHIAEAGANPITQLALTLANGFTFVEYYRSRGLRVDDFAPNLSFFFSNGLDAEYSVIGRVARRIWARTMRYKYGATARSQRLKYHIQTSGRSLHAQEIAFNDIRTTLQALNAIYDSCNSLHTNAYDEAITTPTEESVRRAVAIQMIINKELGLARNENPLQGAFVIEELTDLVEQAVLAEFRRISERGGVLGAMERMYQRTKIQDESLTYESLKHSGKLPIVGVNMFLDPAGSPTIVPEEVIRSTVEEKECAIASREAFVKRNQDRADPALKQLARTVVEYGNTFEALLETTKVCTLGQISHALYQVGGQYRRNM